jgi:hypothetical protein
VLVHVHDIFLPSDYPRTAVVENLWFWSEQYLLQAFLSFNRQFEVLWSASAMQFSHDRILDRCFPAWTGSYANMHPSTAIYPDRGRQSCLAFEFLDARVFPDKRP